MLLQSSRILVVSVSTFVLIVFCIVALRGPNSMQVIKSHAHSAAESAAQTLCSDNLLDLAKPSSSDAIHRMFDLIRHPITAKTFVDADGNEFNVTEDAPYWTQGLANEVLILDIDTRVPDGEGEVFDKDKLSWKNLGGDDNGMLSASFMDHYLYSQIHGYDYKFFNAKHMDEHHDTWVKPHAIYEMLHSYRFVVFIDADATIQHLEVPVEWLFNRWGITDTTSIAMPIDTEQILDGDDQVSRDSKGKTELNTGVVVAQNLPYTFEMLTAWKTCTSEDRYPGCGQWKEKWSHEQKAFSEYIRYDFNPDNNIVEIPCNEAMGYPGIMDNSWILSNCTGQFIRHHTIDKTMTKTSAQEAMLQSLAEIVQTTLLQNRN